MRRQKGNAAVKAVIFDVDGTLYDQRRLRIRMVFDMLLAVLRDPRALREIRVVRDFRRARELHADDTGGGIADRQYEWGASISGTSPEQVHDIVRKWMADRPLSFLPACRFAWAPQLFAHLRARGIRIGVFSDYPAAEKLRALDLSADVVVSAVDPDVDRLKPDPRGLRIASERLEADMSDCLFVGDRDDKDGECARRAGMAYHILKNPRAGNCFQCICRSIDQGRQHAEDKNIY